jgi:hypothetical protein
VVVEGLGPALLWRAPLSFSLTLSLSVSETQQKFVGPQRLAPGARFAPGALSLPIRRPSVAVPLVAAAFAQQQP